MTASAKMQIDRDEMLGRISDEQQIWDVIVIGGGATGLGAALDATTRGYKTLLVEKYDFGKGTSSRSTKLVHGGVRYLRQGHLGLVRDSLRERGIMMRNAPHLVRPLGFVIPAYRFGTRFYYGAGLKIYDRLAGRLSFGRSRFLRRGDVLERLPQLEPDRLRGGVLYYDGQFDDARVIVALARTVAEHGGTLLNYCGAAALVKEGEKVTGAEVVDAETGRRFHIRSKCVINATGVFADSVRKMDDRDVPEVIRPSQGVHLVVPEPVFPGVHALMIPHTDDGRVLFAIPWHGHVVIGTTDTAVPTADPEPLPRHQEIEFLLSHAGRFLAQPPSAADVTSVFTGLRPLVSGSGEQSTKTISRDHSILVSASGLITITGGKWTTYRKMAEDVIDEAAARAGLPSVASRTGSVRLSGGGDSHGPPGEWMSFYGSEAGAVEELCRDRPELGRLLHPSLPYRACEVIWAARNEMARTVEDVLARRTRALFLNVTAALESAPAVAKLLASEFGKDGQWEARQLTAFQEVAAGYQIDSPVR